MLNIIFALGLFSLLVILFGVSVLAGRKFGRWQLAHETEHKLEVVNVAEGAVFALLGLLIAFTFSGAYDRFELRKVHIMDEANAFETAYQRLDFLINKKQDLLREDFRRYLDLHLATYQAVPDFNKALQAYKQSRELEKKIWKELVELSEVNRNQSLTQLVVPAVNTMFEVANTGTDLMLLHAPLAIMALLLGLAALGAFLAGYSTAESKARQSIHILSYVVLTALTIYVIIDLELPRVGLIRVDPLDRILMEVRNEM